jgi:lipopolysaccharide export system protein LptC
LLKRALPVIGVAMLVLVAVWPRLAPWLESVRLGFPVIDLREARELRMLNPRYAGVDRFNRPYVVTSEIGRQVPNRDDLMSLERPRAEILLHRGASVVVTAATAMYQSQVQRLDLLDEVNLIHENGTRFATQSARVDVSTNTAEGHDPVTGHGPSGDIAAQGFRILEKGDTILFTGKTNLLLKGAKQSANPSMSPPTLPAEVSAAAAEIEATATAAALVSTDPAAPAAGIADPAPAGSREVAKRQDKLPARNTAVGDKPKPHDG